MGEESQSKWMKITTGLLKLVKSPMKSSEMFLNFVKINLFLLQELLIKTQKVNGSLVQENQLLMK